VKTLSVDEKTGIQALERISADLPMKQGQCRKQEYEYERHGTQCLIANWDVAEGKVISPSVGDTRTEEDFQRHIQQTVESDPSVKQWRFVLDNLNTHQSQALVLYVAKLVGIPVDQLGVKGRSGILKDKKTRAAFLRNKNHPVYFIYTPRHCSWLNQIEIWFGIITRKLIKRGNFISIQDLKMQILDFIRYYNAYLSKPFQWTYNGKPCCT
jgi:putative transposase